MTAEHFITFAYGSNRRTVRITNRCPSARSLGVGELRGYELLRHEKSKDGSGKCDIAQTHRPGASVFGVLYKMANKHHADLDEAEGIGSGCDETEKGVLHGADPLSVKVYVATAIDPMLKPYSWYRALVIPGAKECGLPADYSNRMKAVSASNDSDKERRDENMRLIVEARL